MPQSRRSETTIDERLLLPWLFVLWAMPLLAGCAHLRNQREVVTTITEHDSERAAEHDRKGKHQLDKGHLNHAETAFQNALLADPSYGPAHNHLGLVYFEKGDLYSAAWSFERAAEFLPGRPEPLNNLALVYEQVGFWEQAIPLYESAASMEPRNPEYLANLIRARRQRGDLDPSLEAQMRQLMLLENRPEWRGWLDDQLMLFLPKDILRLRRESEPPEEISTPQPQRIMSPEAPADSVPTPDGADAGPTDAGPNDSPPALEGIPPPPDTPPDIEIPDALGPPPATGSSPEDSRIIRRRLNDNEQPSPR